MHPRPTPPTPPHANPWTTHETKRVYDNPWIAVDEHRVTQPQGQPGIYGVVHFKNTALGIIPLQWEDGQWHTWLVGQWRYTLNEYSWEIPEGGGPAGEDHLTAAQRELKEETGLTARLWQPILHLHLSNSVSDEYGCVFLAMDLTAGQTDPDPTEVLHVRRLPLAEAVQMAEEGQITDGMSVAGLLRVETLRLRGSLNDRQG